MDLEAQECKFKKPRGCYALEVTCCPGYCSFRKTEEQYHKDVLRAERILSAKGLERVIKKTSKGSIVTVKERI